MAPNDVNMDIGDEPLEYRPKTVSWPQVSDEMVASLALGMEDDLIVAARHGLSMEGYLELASQQWFQNQVSAKRAEYEKTGVTFKTKAAWMAGELLDQVYLQASSMDASLNQKHEVLKTLLKAGGLEPKEEKVQNTGPSFSINIDLGGAHSVSLSNNAPAVLEAQVKEITGS
jgi:hypothetical protein